MTIQCPHCGHSMTLKGVRAGHFTPACPACKGRFDLTIPADANAQPVARMIDLTGPPAATLAPRAATATATATMATNSTVTATMAPPASVAPPVAPSAMMSPPSTVTAAPPMGLGVPAQDVQAATLQQLAPVEAEPDDAPELSGNIGGYEIQKMLGRGGMGQVYLARQVSLDRNVALKTLAPKLAGDAEFVNRFTREAYAAAQLTHHNVVAIHDIGEAKRVHYFSMEFVEGQSLADVIKDEGAIDPEVAAGYVLQAARGLKFAHDHGMVHRDIKPDNLLLNEQGVVKVADLGLVKRAGTKDATTSGNITPGAADMRTTQAHVFFGTPFYMAPEQAMNAAGVDLRADIYSLGCTLYALLTGRPPFTGKTVVEVLSKHAATPVTPPEKFNLRITGPLSAIVQKMMAKRVEDRYQNLGGVIHDLEEYLGVVSSGPFRPKDEHVRIIEIASKAFNDAPMARLRPKLIASFYAACALGAVASVFLFSDPAWRVGMAGGLVGFAVLSTIIYLFTVGVTKRTYEFRKMRQLVWSAGPVEWFKWVAIAFLVGYLLHSFGLLFSWIAFGALAAGVATGFHFSIDLLRDKQRKIPVQQSEALVKQMRLKGLEENALRQFVCHYAGKGWEEFYEALFGYEAKLTARRMWGKDDRGHDRKKHAAWRDTLARWVDAKIERKKLAKEAKYLAKIEAKALAARGIDEKLAKKQAMRNSERFVERAATVKEESVKRSAVTLALDATGRTRTVSGNTDPTARAEYRPWHPEESVVVMKPGWMNDDSTTDDEHGDGSTRKRQSAFARRYGSPVDLLLGQKIRFVLGVLCLAGFAMWWNMNGGAVVKKEASDLMGSRQEVVEQVALDPSKAIVTAKSYDLEVTGAKPLTVPMVPATITTAIGTWSGGIAGAILILGSIFSARLVGFTVLLAAAVALFGPRLSLPVIDHPAAWMCNLAAVAVALFGMFWFRGRAA